MARFKQQPALLRGPGVHLPECVGRRAQRPSVVEGPGEPPLELKAAGQLPESLAADRAEPLPRLSRQTIDLGDAHHHAQEQLAEATELFVHKKIGAQELLEALTAIK